MAEQALATHGRPGPGARQFAWRVAQAQQAPAPESARRAPPLDLTDYLEVDVDLGAPQLAAACTHNNTAPTAFYPVHKHCQSYGVSGQNLVSSGS